LLVIFFISLLIASDSQFSFRLSSFSFLPIIVTFNSFVFYYYLKLSHKQKNIKHRKTVFLILLLSVVFFFITWVFVHNYIANNFFDDNFHIISIWSNVALFSALALAFVINIEYTDLIISKLKK